ncbi:LacI family DNA-binding transcriptional regulator [Arcanobacterium hippocoleae]
MLASAQKLGYVRNEAATQLARKSSDMIGLLLRETRNPAYGYLYDQILAESFKRNLFVVTMSAGDYYHDRGELIRMSRLMQLRPAGIYVASGLIQSDDIAPFASQVPTIVLGRMTDIDGLHAVSYNEIAHGNMLADAVAAAGHRRIIVVVTDDTRSHTEHLRAVTMINRLHEHGAEVLPITEDNIIRSRELLLQKVRELMKDRKATAVMFPNDVRALNFMQDAKNIGMRVPGDIGVSGCDGLGRASELSGLLTVRMPLENVCSAAAEAMLRVITKVHDPADLIRISYSGVLQGGKLFSANWCRLMPIGANWCQAASIGSSGGGIGFDLRNWW